MSEQWHDWEVRFQIAHQYRRLSLICNPSEREMDKISGILELALYDPELSPLLEAVDDWIVEDWQVNQ